MNDNQLLTTTDNRLAVLVLHIFVVGYSGVNIRALQLTGVECKSLIYFV